jgi:hypothetical protein
MVLVKQFRADIPARPAADTGPAIYKDVHLKTDWKYWNKGIFPVLHAIAD